MAAVFLGVSIYGSMQLEQQYEAKWFLPTGTSVRNYMEINDEVVYYFISFVKAKH